MTPLSTNSPTRVLEASYCPKNKAGVKQIIRLITDNSQQSIVYDLLSIKEKDLHFYERWHTTSILYSKSRYKAFLTGSVRKGLNPTNIFF